ncbi:AlbA family DNA-binding domain-containing protein [Moorella sulfitireducens]|uniref:AlbA family DNA-binding domain-containing protein n=1 Tax=Neomoorella sulfitireducens TaxID=2972948 RepID=UPI0021ABBA28|nr:ATP-binding protein [Moorella sulfitireducens]
MRRLEFDTQELLRELQALLVHPREDLHIEVKDWLDLSNEEHKANLAKAMLALANSGGGYILLGFTQGDAGYIPQQPRPKDVQMYSHDSVTGIIRSYADPPFHCEVYHVPHPDTGEPFPIILVPGGHRVPIRAKRSGPGDRHVRENTYYIRRPGPSSEPPRTAQEWDDLLRRCLLAHREELLNSIRAILLGEPSSPEVGLEAARKTLDEWISQSRMRWKAAVTQRLGKDGWGRYEHGTWSVAYAIIGNVEPPSSLSGLVELLREVKGHESGWPPWWVPTRDPIKPYPYGDVVECLIAEPERLSDGAHSDFWRASREGKLFLIRGYQEDSYDAQHRGIQPGTIVDLVLPIWRVGECLLHAHRLATRLAGQSASVLIRFTWEGLANRVLSSWVRPERYLSYDRRCYQNTVTSELLISAGDIADQLPEAVKEVTKPLYEAFEFFDMPPAVIREELERMRKRHY